MSASIQLDEKWISKYNQPVPRYTSYPTVPFWQQSLDSNQWKLDFSTQFDIQNSVSGISLYLHLPFCEALCTYCGCNKRITTNHQVEDPYIEALLREWALYKQLMNEKPILRELHLGGGTPTFFSPENLEYLLKAIIKDCILHEDFSFSIEGHPNNTTLEHLQVLQQLGFKRVSYGVQDLDPEVQRVINRIQPFEAVERVTLQARELGFTSVNFDLIYGLPLQTEDSILDTIQQVLTLKPDRIAFYSYAHVPWTSKAQRLFEESDLPSPSQKIRLYCLGRKLLLEAGYIDIGMDHFALIGDELNLAKEDGTLQRNFMGYTVQDSNILLGLGVSSISDTGTAFAQNEKTIHAYYAQINKGELAVTKGFFLKEEDIAFRKYIIDIACKGRTEFQTEHLPLLNELCFPRLLELKNDGFIEFDEHSLLVKPNGILVLRMICSAFDLHLIRSARLGKQTFSQSI